MIRDFGQAAILTSQNPEAFLNFRYTPGDGSIFFSITTDSSVPNEILFVNGIDINKYLLPSPSEGDYTIYISNTGDPSVASFFVNTRHLYDFDYNLTIDVSGDVMISSSTNLLTDWTNNGWSFPIGGPYPGTPDLSVWCYIIDSSGYLESNNFLITGGEEIIIDVSIDWANFVGSYDVSLYIYEIGGVNPITSFQLIDETQNIFYHNTSLSTTSAYLRIYGAVQFPPSGTAQINAAQFKVFNIYTTESSAYSIDVSINNRPYIVNSDEINTFETSNVQVDDETSYLVLRTNPKFTGNIKLSIDPSNNMYLDTFKISDILNNKKYRKQIVSGNSVLSGDIRRTFSTLPLGELYRLDAEDTLNISVPKTEIFKQYNVNYSYGARLFEDELYDDDYALLAPIWINSKLPDYFAIFRIDGVYNEETYPGEDIPADLTDLAQKYLEQGELIKSWGLKEATPVGTYLRNHLNELLSVRAPLFLSLSDPTQKDPDPNTWYGMAVDKGIITGRSETPYFFDQKNTFTDTNAFLSEGFERLNLLCPNLINMEYIFSDHDVSLYTMHRYFGLYLTENELYEISYYANDPDASIQILSLDGNESSIFFNSSIFDVSSGDILDVYKNRIFTLNDIQTIKRITNVNQVNGLTKSYVEEWLNKPGSQLFSVDVEEKTSNKFITINLKNNLSQGEHLRIVDKTQFKIWEIYGLDSELLNEGDAWTYASVYSDSSMNYPTIYRSLFSVKGDKGDQIKAIKKAFDLFEDYANSPFETNNLKIEEGQLSIEIKDYANLNDIWFQRLTAQTVSNPSDPSSMFNTAAGYDDITFFGVFEPTFSDFERLTYDSSYGPINFELYGDRMSITVKFYDISTNYMYSFDSSVGKYFETYTMYMGTDSWYRLVSPFIINTSISDHSFSYITDPTQILDKAIISTSNKLFTTKGKWNAYSTYPLIISLMGINPVKDMDFTVYDASLGYESEYWYAREDDLDTYSLTISTDSSVIISERNSYEIIDGIGIISINNIDVSFNATSSNFYFNTFDGSAFIISSGVPVTLTYDQIDGSKNYDSYVPGMSEERINSYYVNSSTKAKLKYGLTVPYVSKWVGLGYDCRNNPIRLLLDASFYDSSSNFIPFGNNFEGEISFPVFKYLDPGTRAWEDYVFYDVNDVLSYDIDGSILHSTIKEFMITNSTIDVFSKILYSNHNIDNTKIRSSIAYYNDYKQSIDTILTGLNLSFILDDNAKNTFDIRDWDRYRISFISTTSKNRDNNYPIEVFINENTETILVVWYQGTETLNFNKRYSSYFGGKSLLGSISQSELQYQAFRTGDKYWSFIKTPFIVNNASLSSDFINIYGVSSIYDTSICSPYAQLNWNFGDKIYSIFNAYSNNIANSNSFEFFNRQYNTFRQYIDYTYIKDAATYGSGVLNHGYSYMNNSNIYDDNTCSLNTLKYILGFNNVGYYIFRGNLIYENSSFSVPPIIISINDPRSYKNLYTYNGWYRPKFNNILNFNYNESAEIINVVEKDFTLSNTNFKEYNNIPQLWYNKVVNQVTAMDVSTKNAIGYIEDFNVFKSQWDGEYYIIDTSTTQILTDGYNSSLELPSYFGSKLIKLPATLELNSWDFTTAGWSDGRTNHVLQFNLTRKIINMFKNNETFTDNWAALTTSDNVIDNYIKNTISGYYNISKPKIKVEIWTKPYNGSRISYTLDDTFTLNSAANVDANLYFSNNEYQYIIFVPILPDLTYFIKFVLFEK